MSHKNVCIDLARIRKSIYKGQKHAELRDSLDKRYARSYLMLLVSGHHLNNEIREHERQMTEKEPLEFAAPQELASTHVQDLVDNSSEIDDPDLIDLDLENLESDEDSVSDCVSASDNSDDKEYGLVDAALQEDAAIREAVDLDQPHI